MFTSLLSGLGLKLLGGAAITIAVAGVVLGIRNSGRVAERVEAQTRILKQVEVRNEIDRRIKRLSGPTARQRLLNEWSRD